MPRRSPFLLLTILVAGAAVGLADSLNCRLVGNWPFGPLLAVALDPARNLAFMGSGGGVYVLDVADPTRPQKLSEAIHTRGNVHGLCYHGNRLFIAAAEAGMEIWDITTPSGPSFLGRLDTRTLPSVWQ